MQPSVRAAGSAPRTYVTALIGVVLTTAVILFPEDAFKSSVSGLRLWFDIVLPALLPFFVLAEIMMGLGVIHFIGVLLEPLMRPLFRIPGAGAFAVAIGLAAGYPLGAKVAGDLTRARLATGVEGERLVAFANTADPLFLVGAVSVGMFGLPELGSTLAVSHYAAVICVGFLMRFHDPKGAASTDPPREGSVWVRAFRAMHQARLNDGRPLGTLFGDSVRETMNSLLFVGGTIIMFSVFMRMLTVAGVVGRLTATLGPALAAKGIDASLLDALAKGVVEITNGAQAASAANAPLLHKAVAAAAIIAWSGLSVHAQVAAMVHGTQIRIAPYIVARAACGIGRRVCVGADGPGPRRFRCRRRSRGRTGVGGAGRRLHKHSVPRHGRRSAAGRGLTGLGGRRRGLPALCSVLDPHSLVAASPLQFAAALLHGAERPFQRLL